MLNIGQGLFEMIRFFLLRAGTGSEGNKETKYGKQGKQFMVHDIPLYLSAEGGGI